ncbi:GNAT family N-acetyltransferase [Streptomyces sp. NPDC057386]|uniref:GNAT family N-acetyltransferase n=1 Tax=unclassified Streptomyces TaxID=2593676 RepID=UPI003626EB5E
MSSDIEIRDDRGAGRLEALGAGGEVVGRIEYFVLDAPEPALVPVHAVVEPAHEGKGIAGSLARELYGIAAREGVPVAPLCPYVTKWAARHPEEAPPADPALVRAAKVWLAAHPGRF